MKGPGKKAKTVPPKQHGGAVEEAINFQVNPPFHINLSLIDTVIKYIESGVFDYSNYKYMESYNAIVDKCVDDKNGKILYEYYTFRVRSFLSNVIVPRMEAVGKGEAVLKQFIKCFEDFKLFANYMKKIFDYVDRMFYNFNQQNYERLPQRALNLFKSNAFVKSEQIIVQSILLELKKERESCESNRNLVNKSLRAIVAMGTEKASIVKRGDDYVWKGHIDEQYFAVTFEKKFLEESKLFYKKKAEDWMASMTTPDYCQQINRVFTEEENRADNYINTNTKNKLMIDLINILLKNNVDELLNRKDTGLRALLDHKRIPDIEILYEVFQRDSTTYENMASFLMPYIEDRGTEIITDTTLKDNPLGKELLKFRREMNKLVAHSFKKNTLLTARKDKAFTVFLAKSDHTPKYLAYYCDDMFRTGLKGDLDKEEMVNAKLEEAMDLLCCLTSRDTFVLSYSTFLSKRLLNKQFLSIDVEKQFLSKLKFELGSTSVNKLSIMFTDLDASDNLMKSWKGLKHGGNVKGIELSFRVLTDGSWPEKASPPIPLPLELKDSIDQFVLFYTNQKPQTKIKWMFHHGTMDLKTLFTKETYYFTCSTTQGIIMLAFNYRESFKYNELLDTLKLPEQEVDSFLRLMCNPRRYKLLLKENIKSPKFSPEERISINLEFKSQQRAISLLNQQKGKKQTTEDIDKAANDDELKRERQFVLDAMIVKIMKTRKQLNHIQLVTETIQMIKMFRAQPAMIKQRIEALIEREYLERDDDDRTLYRYLP